MINLIFASDMERGKQIIDQCNLNEDDCAVITEISHFDHAKLFPNEIIYTHTTVDSELLANFVRRIYQLPKFAKLNLTIVNI